MGGCAGKPKDLDISPESLPSEAPASPKKAEGETVVAQENVNEKKEEPLVDLSEPKQEAGGDSSSESKPADNSTEETEKKPSEDKAEAGQEEAIKPAEDVKKAEDVTVTKEVKTVELDATPRSEDKSDAPLVTV